VTGKEEAMRRIMMVVACLVAAVSWLSPVSHSRAEAGRIGGPATAMVFVPAFDSLYVDAPFAADQLAMVTIAGDGNGDLELFLYDADGHVSTSTGFGDRKLAMMRVYRSGFFVVEIRNRGPWASAVLVTMN
jgi:hypothetical protein